MAGEIGIWGAASISFLLALYLAMRKGPRPDAWPLQTDSHVPILIALFGFGAWAFTTQFLNSLMTDFPALIERIHDPDKQRVVTANAAEFFGRLVAIVAALVLALTMVKPDDPMRRRPKLELRALFWGIGLYLLALPIVLVLSPQEDDPARMPQEAVRQLMAIRGYLPRTALFFNVVIAAPLFEEIIFRGLLQGAFRRHLNASVAIVLAAGLFAMLHDLGVMIPVFILGLLLGVLYEKSRGLALPLIVHLLHNFITFLYITVYSS